MPDTPVLTPYLCCRDAAAAIDFYVRAFGATVTMRLAAPDGKVGHAEVMIQGVPVMLSDEFPGIAVSPQELGGTPMTLHLLVPDVDAAYARAIAAGATAVRPVADQFYGDRSGLLLDPFGHKWNLATRTEEVSDEEVRRRAKEMYGME